MTETVLAAAADFTTVHIAVTGLICGVFAAAISAVRLRGGRRALDALAIGILTAGAVFLFRKSANMTPLNNDGLQGFSANDWLAPALTFVVLGIYGAFRRPDDPRRFEQTRVAATIVAFAINVITI